MNASLGTLYFEDDGKIWFSTYLFGQLSKLSATLVIALVSPLRATNPVISGLANHALAWLNIQVPMVLKVVSESDGNGYSRNLRKDPLRFPSTLACTGWFLVSSHRPRNMNPTHSGSGTSLFGKTTLGVKHKTTLCLANPVKK